MRVEPGQHAVDRRFDEGVLVRHLDIVGADPLEHVAEQVELAIGVGRGRDRLAPGQEARLGRRHGDDRAERDTGKE